MDAALDSDVERSLHVWRSAVAELVAAVDRVADDAEQASRELALLHVLSERAAQAFAHYEAHALGRADELRSR